MDDMQNSTLSASFLRCGHAMHTKCLNTYLRANNIACPMCKKSVIDPKMFEAQMDMHLASMQMPEEYKDTMMRVLCNDCLQKSKVKFHIGGGKCSNCCSYNTTRIEDQVDPDPEPVKEITQEDKPEEDDEDEWHDCE